MKKILGGTIHNVSTVTEDDETPRKHILIVRTNLSLEVVAMKCANSSILI